MYYGFLLERVLIKINKRITHCYLKESLKGYYSNGKKLL